MGWLIVGMLPLVAVAVLTAVLYVRRPERKAPPVAVLESREPREALQLSMRRGD